MNSLNRGKVEMHGIYFYCDKNVVLTANNYEGMVTMKEWWDEGQILTRKRFKDLT